MLTKAYHGIIKKEYEIAVDPKDRVIQNYEYVLKKDEIIDIIGGTLSIGNQASERIFEELYRRGFLVMLPPMFGDNSDAYRSLHMDIAIRSSRIRTHYNDVSYIVNPRLFLCEFEMPSEADRKPIDSREELRRSIESFIGNRDIAKAYNEAISEYLSGLGSQGLDDFQAFALSQMLQGRYSVFLISAPTGSGKTEIFLFYILARLIKSKMSNEDSKAIAIYPRKALSIDQMERLIRLLYITNERLRKYGLKLYIGLRDGDTPRDMNDRDKIPSDMSFRGVRCPRCGETLKYHSYGGLDTVKCPHCNRVFDFILSTRRSMGRRAPDILVTNPWTLENRVMDGSPDDISVDYFSRLEVLVLDEAHEYIGLMGGIMSSLLNIIRSIQGQGLKPTIIISSATIPGPQKFAEKLTGARATDIGIFVFGELIRNGTISVSGKRLALIATFEMHPRYSWSTYVQLWSVMMSYLFHVYRLDNRSWRPQSIVFINYIKELRRTRRGFEESISLGEPRDHIAKTYGLNQPALDPYIYWHYASPSTLQKLLQQLESKGYIDELAKPVAEIHSEVPLQERVASLEGIRKGEIAVAFSTSSLELGVDYKDVSFILNVGLEDPISVIQRIGRGGRSYNTLRTVLGIILSRNLPSETLTLYSGSLQLCPELSIEQIGSGSYELPIASQNPQVIKRQMLIEALVKMAQRGANTHASGRPIIEHDELKNFLDEIANNLR